MTARPPAPSPEVFILAGGLSSRMGTDKARLRLNGRPMLSHVRLAASNAGLTVRVLRRDLLPRCGPIGGIYSGLKRTQADRVLFLACDMPAITPAFLHSLLRHGTRHGIPLFTCGPEGLGFPLLLPTACISTVLEQIQAGRFSLQTLAATLNARVWNPPKCHLRCLQNLNHPADLARFKHPIPDGGNPPG